MRNWNETPHVGKGMTLTNPGRFTHLEAIFGDDILGLGHQQFAFFLGHFTVVISQENALFFNPGPISTHLEFKTNGNECLQRFTRALWGNKLLTKGFFIKFHIFWQDDLKTFKYKNSILIKYKLKRSDQTQFCKVWVNLILEKYD